MDNQKLFRLNNFINKSYECFTFTEFLKLAVLKLHEFVMYDSGMFFCGISKDCSFFKPFIGGSVEEYYRKHSFLEKDSYLSLGESRSTGNEALVYKSAELTHGIVRIVGEQPRSGFLTTQKDYYIACMRIVHKGQFLGEIYLHREKGKPDFDDEDMFTLRLMQPHVSTVFNIIHTVTAVRYIETNNQPDHNLGLCLFDYDLSLIGGNVTGVEMLKTVTVFGSSVLFHVKELCEDLEEEKKAGRREGFMSNSILKIPDSDLQIQIFLNNNCNNNQKFKYIVVMYYSDKSRLIAEYQFKFTKRQADIIDGLIQGKNNAQLAEYLNISENTIKTHIKSIYKKVGANNRAELIYILMLNRESS